MSDELYGVFFEDQGAEYLVAVADAEEAAHEEAVHRDEEAFQMAVDAFEGEGEEPSLEDFERMHYVAPVSSALAEDAREQLARGLAVKLA